ncbi:hypothetical protein [Amycolatopsis orientalis]|uniref:hypothetical protein n=1 Tax=Amycolatopsis orientalis TaxID=31958 RepID=UPI00131A0AC8|nr:hypothetical protein [Amycolatopsis orientalis]
MTEEECARLLFALEQRLQRLGLGFAVAQERVIAAEGRSLAPEELAQGPDFDTRSRSSGSVSGRSTGAAASLWDLAEPVPAAGKERLKSGDVVVAPLDVRSRLALLLDLVEVATAGTVAMEEAVVEEFSVVSADGRLTFEDPPEAELRGQAVEPWALTVDAVGVQARQRAADVVALVDELRQLAGVPRREWLSPYGRDDSSYAWSTGEK